MADGLCKVLLFLLSLTVLIQLCGCILPQYTPALSGNGGSIQEIIQKYFLQGLSNVEILGFLATIHNLPMSLRTLKRWLNRMGLKRVNQNTESPLYDIVDAILKEIEECVGSSSGYRDMTMRLRIKHKLKLRRDTVMQALRVIDPEGVQLRKKHRLKRRKYVNPGPNFLWHIDGWDKLKPFGFSIHGCIDGFSRRLLWLEVSSTNKDPKVVIF